MNRSRTWAITILTLSLFNCREEEEFDQSLVPGTYTGQIAYFTDDHINLPELSTFSGYEVTISEAAQGYTLSFDKSFVYQVPDLEIRVNTYPPNKAHTLSIVTVVGQPYSNDASQISQGQPAAYFTNDKEIRRINCTMALVSNDPDSVYYLNFTVRRTY